MVIVVNDSALGDVRELSDFELDLAFGSDENAFSLECEAAHAPAEGQFVSIDGTEYGGVVDQASYEAGREATGSILCKGRTWHGILAGKRLLPDSGSGYLSVSGKAGEALASLIERMGLSGLFSAAADDTAIEYTFDRFTDGYSGLKAMAKANGRKVAMRRKGGKVEISLPPAVDYANKVDSDLLDFTLTSVHRCVNHLVCAGTGELEDRAVVHFYADGSGNVSHTQTFFGVDEICALYDYSNADEEKLEEEGKKKLQEYQTQGSVEVEAHDDIDVDVGDVISARDNAHGRTVTATVAKKIVKVSRGVATYSYEVGSETTTKTSSSGTAESTSGGHAYFAGSGLTLTNYTFSAEVDSAALKAVESKADAAAARASNASAAAGKAEAFAKAATDAAAANAKAIAGKQDKLTAGANVTISGSTISATDTTYGDFDGATASAAGSPGLVPAPAMGAATRYLRSDGTWQVPPYPTIDPELSSASANPVQNKAVNSALGKKVDDTAKGVSAALNRLTTGLGTPSDADYYISQVVGGGASATSYHRRPVSALWSYVKGKADAVYAAKSHVHSAFDVQFSPRRASTGSVTPVHASFMGAGRCLSAFLPPSGIKLEYSTDGGATWLDYGTGDAHKRRLASMPNPRNGYRLGGPNAQGALGDMLRITYEPSDGRYGLVQSALVWVSTNGGSDLLCSVETSTMGAKGTWVERVAPVKMAGWSGPNVVDLPQLTFGGYEGQTGNTYGWRFTFAKEADVPGKTPEVCTIDLYGTSVWNPANEMMRSGHLYTWDDEGKGHFIGSADSATEAAKLKTARTVSISGAVSGSATWDGSGDLSIVVAGDTAAAGFLAAHPVGTFIETNGYDPSDYGGEWSMVPSIGPYTWLRTK